MDLLPLGVLALAVVGVWIVGEATDQRALRLLGILVPCLVVPFAFQLGAWSGRVSGAVDRAESIAGFVTTANDHIAGGDSAALHDELRRLDRTVDDYRDHPGEKPSVARLNGEFDAMVERLVR